MVAFNSSSTPFPHENTMQMLLVSVITLLVLSVFALGFFWLFLSANLRRATCTRTPAKFYRWDD